LTFNDGCKDYESPLIGKESEGQINRTAFMTEKIINIKARAEDTVNTIIFNDNSSLSF